MAEGICIFAESFHGKLDNTAAELVGAAHSISAATGEKIKALVIANECGCLIEQLKELGVDEICYTETKRDMLFQDDALSVIAAEMIKKTEPSVVLIPATMIGRSVFSRCAARLGCGMTADCTELQVAKRDDGSFFIKQNKPSFGNNVYVTITMKPGVYPQMISIRPGVYEAFKAVKASDPTLLCFDDIPVPVSMVEVIASEPAKDETDSILAAETVVVAGRGAATEENFPVLQKFAEKIGAAIGCTRPIADTGFIPFEHQIGQTGATIHPRICISAGVSGAIQHTEGIKDTKLFIAINTDENAAIFTVADYGIKADMKDVMEAYMRL